MIKMQIGHHINLQLTADAGLDVGEISDSRLFKYWASSAILMPPGGKKGTYWKVNFTSFKKVGKEIIKISFSILGQDKKGLPIGKSRTVQLGPKHFPE